MSNLTISNFNVSLPSKEIISPIYPQNGLSFLDKECFCLYLQYDLWIALNFFLSLFYLLNIMFKPFERGKLKELNIDTEGANTLTFVFLLTINIYFFLMHFLLEPLTFVVI